MTLIAQNVPIQFQAGLDTKSDEKAVVPGRFLELENGVFTRTGVIKKRFGYDVLSRRVNDTGANITAAVGTAVFNEELVLLDGSSAYSFAPAMGEWTSRGTVVPIRATDHPILHNSYAQTCSDVAVAAGLRCVVWVDSRGGLRYSVQDQETGAYFASDVAVNNNASTSVRCRVIAFQGHFFILYSYTSGLYYKKIPTGTPSLIGPEVSLGVSLASAAPSFDAAVINDRLFIAYNETINGLSVSYIDSAFVLSGTALSTAFPAAGGIVAFAGPGDFLWVGYVDTANTRVRAALVPYSLSTVVISGVVEVIANASRINGYATSTTSAVFNYEITTTTEQIRTCSFSYPSGAGTASYLKRDLALSSKVFQYGTGYYFVAAKHSALQKTFFVLKSNGDIVAKLQYGTAEGRRNHSGATESYTLSDVPEVDTGVYEFAGSVAGKLYSESGELFTRFGAHVTRLSFTTDVQNAQIGSNCVLASGAVQSYDGTSFVETGFHVWPEGISADQSKITITTTQEGTGAVPEIFTVACVAATRMVGGQYFTFRDGGDLPFYAWYTIDAVGTDPAPGGTGIVVAILSTDTATDVATKTATAIDAHAAFLASSVTTTVTVTNAVNGATTVNAANGTAPNGVATGSIVAGTYLYVAMYEWTDNFGQIHRSAPSESLSVTVGAGDPKSVTVTVPTLRLTSRPAASVRIVVYRTKASGTVFYRLSPIASPTVNSTTVDAVTFLDQLADSAIGVNEFLYTNGGVLENLGPPAASMVTTYRGRMFLAGLSEPNTIAYSKYVVPGEAVAFPGEFLIRVDQRGGPITGMAALDDKLILFKESSIFVLAGDGPTDAGTQDDFGAPQLVTTDAGCSNPKSIVLVPNGLMFQTPKGIYLIDRGLNVTYAGQHVESFNGQTITGAALVPNTNQVRFTIADGSALVFDYLMGQWSTFTNHSAVDCDVWLDEFVFVKSNGLVYKENRTLFTDGPGVPIKLKMTTSWLAVAGLQGYQRTRRILVLGEYKGPHTLRVRVGTDYSPAFSQEEYFDTTALVGSGTYGSTSPYGYPIAVYGGTFEPYQFGVHVQFQKSQAFRVSIEDVQGSEYNEGLSVSGLTFTVGLKKGLNKVPAAKRS